MKYCLTLLAFLTFATTAVALAPPPYEQMTYEQLKQVDQSKLLKAEKKAWKKAFRKAAKTHRKVEKKKAKAKEKRRKLEEKARKERKKLLAKRLKEYERSYSKTRILMDEYEPHIQIIGNRTSWQANSSLNFILSRPVPTEYFMRAFYNPNTQTLTLQVYCIKSFTEKIPVTPEGVPLTSPMQYAAYANWWGNYYKATLRGGSGRKIIAITKNAKNSAGSYYNFYEESAIYIDTEDLFQSIRNNENLSIKVSTRSKTPVLITLTPDYIAGFIKKLSEVDSRLAHFAKTAEIFLTQESQKLSE